MEENRKKKYIDMYKEWNLLPPFQWIIYFLESQAKWTLTKLLEKTINNYKIYRYRLKVDF
jgi:hypothetical protein